MIERGMSVHAYMRWKEHLLMCITCYLLYNLSVRLSIYCASDRVVWLEYLAIGRETFNDRAYLLIPMHLSCVLMCKHHQTSQLTVSTFPMPIPPYFETNNKL